MSCYEKRTFECMTKSSFLFKKYLQQCYMFNEFTFYGNVAVQVLVQLVSQLSANLRCRNKRPGWPPFSHWPLGRPATIFQLDRDPQESWIRETSKEILHLKFTFIFIAHVFMPKQTLWPLKKSHKFGFVIFAQTKVLPTIASLVGFEWTAANRTKSSTAAHLINC